MDLIATTGARRASLVPCQGPEPLGCRISTPPIFRALPGGCPEYQGDPAGSADRRGPGQHLCQRGAFSGGHLASARRGRGVLQGAEGLRSWPCAVCWRSGRSAGGSTLRDYAGTGGELGYFQHRFRVYDREDQPAPPGLPGRRATDRSDRPLELLLRGLPKLICQGRTLAVRSAHLYRDAMALRLRSILLAAPTSLLAGAAEAPPLWVVHGAHCTIYLFGSVHILPPDLNWEPGRLERAVAHAQEICLRNLLDNASMTDASQAAETRGCNRRARPFPPNSPPPTVPGWSNWRRPTPCPWRSWIVFSPGSRRYGCRWPATATWALRANWGGAQDPAGRAAPGPPAGFRNAAGADRLSGRRRVVFDQIASLEETFGELEVGPDGFVRLVQAWMTGDLKGLSAEALDPLSKAAPAVYQTMVVRRNEHWRDAVLARLDQPGRGGHGCRPATPIGPEGVARPSCANAG